MTAGVQRSDLLRDRLDRFARALHGVEQGDSEALHNARIASRRLRELLPILQLDHSITKKLGKRLRRVTRDLGTQRDAEVLDGLIDELLKARPKLKRALQRLDSDLRRDASKHGDDAGDVPTRTMARAVRKLEKVAGQLRQEDRDGPARRAPARARAARWAVDARVARRAERVRAVVRAAGALYLPERLHTVRIALKKLRYSVELSEELAGNRVAPVLRTLKRAQDLLGRLHDLQMLIERTREVHASLSVSTGTTAGRELDALIATLEDECRRLHARYMHQRATLVAVAVRLSGRSIPDQRRKAG
jgi:CHAD domain-containing protein